ncbi:MAG: ankyrin repeat-containing domain protein [Monoraphidium minutum]|nr:MAG: ankyrin repeat-containing domain protein [Monoraphidium minutum]
MPFPNLGDLGSKMARLGEKISGPPAIHHAAMEGDLARVRMLAQKQYDLDEIDQKHGRTALHIAAEKCHQLVVGELLDRRAAAARQDRAGRTPLLVAAELGHLQVVQLLVGSRNKDASGRAAALGLRDARGYTPLLAAAASGHAHVLRVLIGAGAFIGDTLENRVSAGHLAARGGHVAALAVLVESGLNPRADTLDRVTLLHEAARHGHAKAVEWLLAAGLDPNVRGLGDSATALELAIVEGCHQAAALLRVVTTAPIAGPLAPPGMPAAPTLTAAVAAGAAAAGGGGGGGFFGGPVAALGQYPPPGVPGYPAHGFGFASV